MKKRFSGEQIISILREAEAGVKWSNSVCHFTLRWHGESGTTKTVAASAAVEPKRQARNRFAGSAEPGRCAAAALAECGSTTGQLCWPGAEGVQCCYAFDVKVLKGLPAATQQEGEAGRQRAANRENAARISRRRRRAAFRGAARRGQMPPSPALFRYQSTNIESGI